MVSIITSVYNSAEYLDRYLDSVMSQTYTDIEVLLIDDHGSDDSIARAHERVQNYTGPISFRFLETERNSGPGVARNIGIVAAKGEYISFVDSDDFIDSQFCELLVESAERNHSDLCCCQLEICDENGVSQGVRKNPPFEDGEFTGEKRSRFLSSYVSYFTTFLYRRDLFVDNSISFPSGRSSEDSAMLCCALLCSKRLSQVDKPMYKYMRRSDSLSSKKDPKRYLQRLSSLGFLMDTVRKNGWYEADKDVIDFIYFKKGYLMSVFDYVDNNEASKEALADIRRELLSRIPDYKSNPHLKSSTSFQALDLLLSIAPSVSVPVISAYLKRQKDSVL